MSPYRWVHPPKFYRATNQYPESAHQTGRLASRNVLFGTEDGQLSLYFVKGSFPSTPSAKTLSISIVPLATYLKPHFSDLALDGNVYGLSFKLLPSGKHPTRSRKPILIGITAPHTPYLLAGIVNGKWKIICGQHDIFMPGPNVECDTRVLPSALALFLNSNSPYFPGGRHPRTSGKGGGLPWLALGAVALLVAAVVLIVLGVQHRRRNPRPRPSP